MYIIVGAVLEFSGFKIALLVYSYGFSKNKLSECELSVLLETENSILFYDDVKPYGMVCCWLCYFLCS